MHIVGERNWSRRLRAYWTEDGLPDLATGVGFLAVAALLWAGAVAPPPWARLLRYVQVVVILGMAFFTRWAVRSAKWRLTYPRTGYVAYARRKHATRQTVAAAMAGIIVVLVLVVTANRWQENAFLVGLSGGMAAIFGWLAWQQAWWRGFAYAAVVMAAAPLAMLLLAGGPRWDVFVGGGGVHFALVGVAQIVGGAWALRRYVKRHPQPPMEEETT